MSAVLRKRAAGVGNYFLCILKLSTTEGPVSSNVDSRSDCNKGAV